MTPRSCGPTSVAFCPSFVLDHYEGYRVELLQDCSREELDVWVEANAAAVRDQLPADLVLCNHVLLGGAVGRAIRRDVRRQGARLRARVLDAWPPRARGVGEARCSTRLRPLRRLGAHPRGGRRGVWSGRPRARGSAGCRHRGVAPAAARGCARGTRCRSAAAIHRIPATRTSASRTRETPSVSQRSSRETNRRSSTSGSSCTTRASTCCSTRSQALMRARSSSDSATTAPSSSSWRPGSAFSSPGRSSIATSSTSSRSRTRASCPRSSRRRSGWSRRRPPRRAARRSSHGTPASPRSPRASRPSIRLRCAGSRRSRPETRWTCAEKLTALLALSPADRDEIRAAARRAAVERWSWKSVADRLLELGR